MKKNKKKENHIVVTGEIDGIEEMTEKAEKYLNILKEAKTIANELASYNFKITFSSENQL